jgi:hypothetical protein
MTTCWCVADDGAVIELQAHKTWNTHSVQNREATIARAPRVVWREGPGCVLVRRVGDEALELTGMAAFVWLALAEPRRIDELEAEVADAAELGDHPLDPELAYTFAAAIERLQDERVITERA